MVSQLQIQVNIGNKCRVCQMFACDSDLMIGGRQAFNIKIFNDSCMYFKRFIYFMCDKTWFLLPQEINLPIKSLIYSRIRLFFNYCPLHSDEICVWSLIIWYGGFLYLYFMLSSFQQYLKGILRNTKTFVYSIQSFIKNVKSIEMSIN